MSNDDPDTVENTGDPNQIPQQDVATGRYVNEGEPDEFDQAIADLGPAPGYGASAAESDRYNFAVAEIEAERAEALRQEAEDNSTDQLNALGAWEDTSGERDDVVIPDPPGEGGESSGRLAVGSGDDGTV
jgi:hypothetical protein